MKIVVVGGVAGGASAAARARRLSETADITIFERGPDVSFANCGLPYHIGGQITDRGKLLVQTPATMQARANVNVQVLTEVVKIDTAGKRVQVRRVQTGETSWESYDKLILSPGAEPIRPPLPGIDDDRIMTLRNLADMDRIKAAVDAGAKRAVVIGGGFIGLELTECLVERDVQVTLVELAEQVMPPLDPEMAVAINEALVDQKVDLVLGDGVAGFVTGESGMTVQTQSGASYEGDFVVLAIGVKPEITLARDAGLSIGERGGIAVNSHMQTSDPDIYAVGDAVENTCIVTGQKMLLPLAGPANRQGRTAADHIFGVSNRHSRFMSRDGNVRLPGHTSTNDTDVQQSGYPAEFPGVQGTAIVKVFDVHAGCTGASEKVLKAAGMSYTKLYLHPTNHVTYYPGAKPMHMKVLFSPDDGKLLGAQITGRAGVDRRLDVFATAIKAGMTVYDLEDLELVYSPQFGAAKDPVNFAGFAGANVLRGHHDPIYCEQIDPDNLGNRVLLDVRNPDENQDGAIPNSVLIPLGKLRSRLDELPRDKEILVYCAQGLRGYLGERILTQNGFKARNITGGYKTWKCMQDARR